MGIVLMLQQDELNNLLTEILCLYFYSSGQKMQKLVFPFKSASFKFKETTKLNVAIKEVADYTCCSPLC